MTADSFRAQIRRRMETGSDFENITHLVGFENVVPISLHTEEYKPFEGKSLAEIAEHAGITRQGVRDSIKRAEHALGEMESKLGLVARYGDTERCAGELREEVSRLRALNTDTLHSPEAEAIADRMTALLDQLRQEA